LREMITIFRVESSGLMKTIRESAGHEDFVALSRAAHTLKGALGTLGATRAFEAARRLEDVARQQTNVGPALADLDQEMIVLVRALQPSPRRRIVRQKGDSHAGTRRKARQRAHRRR
jgi:two-component system, sensor histidine kinase and response regulator